MPIHPCFSWALGLQPFFSLNYRIIGWIGFWEVMPTSYAPAAFEAGSVSSQGGSDLQNPSLLAIVRGEPVNVLVRKLVDPRGGVGYEPSYALHGNPTPALEPDLLSKWRRSTNVFRVFWQSLKLNGRQQKRNTM